MKTEVASDVVEYWEAQAESDGLPDDVLDEAQENLARGKIESDSGGSSGELRDGRLYRSQINFLA